MLNSLFKGAMQADPSSDVSKVSKWPVAIFSSGIWGSCATCSKGWGWGGCEPPSRINQVSVCHDRLFGQSADSLRKSVTPWQLLRVFVRAVRQR